MSLSAKLARQRDHEQSPEKKKFKDCGISREELNTAVLASVKLALAEQKEELNKAISTAVRHAIDDLLTPQLNAIRVELDSTKESIDLIQREVRQQDSCVAKLQARCDTIQAAARSDRGQVNLMAKKVDDLNDKLSELEDRSRRSNIRLVGLKEGEEGDDAIAFLKARLPEWIPALKDREIAIERAHRVYAREQNGSSRPRTVIFKLLNYVDRQAILKGARAAYPVKHHQDNILFFPDYSLETTKRRKEMAEARKKMENLGLQPFLLYPATLKITYNGRQLLFKSPTDAARFLQDHFSPLPGRNDSMDTTALPSTNSSLPD